MTRTPPHRAWNGPVALSLVGLALLASCSKHEDVLARVGSRTVTVPEFTEYARNAGGRYPGSPDGAKAQLLRDLVRRALLLEAVRARGLERDTLAVRRRRQIESEVVSSALVGQLAPRDVPVSDAEARQWYEWRRVEAHAQLIYTAARPRADAALAEIAHGHDFGMVADAFNLRGMLPPGGDLGFLAPGSLVPPLDRYLREAPLGKVIGPIQAPGEGWFIVRVIARRPRQQESFEAQRDPLMESLRQRKQRLLSARAFLKLRDEYRVAAAPDGPYLLFDHYNPAAARGGESPMPPRAPRDRASPLGYYDDARGHRIVFTLDEGLSDLEAGRGGERPNPTMLPSFQQWIESRLVQKVVEIEAERRHLAEDPAVAKQIDDRMNDYLLDSIYQGEVLQAARATDDDVRQVYQREAPMFAKLNSVTLQTLTLPDSSSAVSVRAHVQGATSLREAIVLASPRMQVRDEVVRYPAPDPLWNTLEAQFRALPAGAYGGPVRGEGGWVIFQIVSKDESTEPFDHLPPDVQQGLRSEAQALATERRLEQYTDSLRAVVPVQIDHQRLKSVPWIAAAQTMQLGQFPQ